MMSSIDTDAQEDDRIEDRITNDGNELPHGTASFTISMDYSLDRLHTPRLGIIHLLGWIGIASLLLKYWGGMGAFDAFADLSNRVQWVFWVTNGLLSTMLYAAVLTGCGAVLLAKIHDIKGSLQPGHWMLVLSGIMAIVSISFWTLGVVVRDWFGMSADDSYPGMEFYIHKISMAGAEIVAIIICFLAAIQLNDAFRWRLTFWCLVMGCVFDGVIESMTVLLMLLGFTTIGYQAWIVSEFPVSSILILPILSTTVLIDLKCRIHRDWLHWTGIGIAIISQIWEIITFLLRMFAPSITEI